MDAANSASQLPFRNRLRSDRFHACDAHERGLRRHHHGSIAGSISTRPNTAVWSTSSTSTSSSGGSPTNVAVAAARLGERSALISRTGPDPFGAFIHAALTGFGVDDRYVTECVGFQTPVTFCETFPPDHFPIYFYREPKAPDLEIYPTELDFDAIEARSALLGDGEWTVKEPSRSATLAALEAREHEHPTVLDLDYRPSFWASRDDALDSATRGACVTPPSPSAISARSRWPSSSRDPDVAADRLLELGCELAVVKLGPERRTRQDERRTSRGPADIESTSSTDSAPVTASVARSVTACSSGWTLDETIRLRECRGRHRRVASLVF